MEFQIWHLIVLIIVAILGFLGNTKFLKYMVRDTTSEVIEPVKKGLEDVKVELIEQRKIISKHGQQLDRYNDNGAFYKSLDYTIQDGLKYLKDEESATTVLNCMGNGVKEAAKDIISIGVDTIKDEMVKAKCFTLTTNVKNSCGNLLGKKFSTGCLRKFNSLTRKYIADTCLISDNWVNDKDKRFRSITSVYIENVVTHFINYFKDNKNLIIKGIIL